MIKYLLRQLKPKSKVMPAMESEQTTTMSMSKRPSSGTPLTLLELFQSQSCSSCPPANDNVLPYSNDPDILVLTYQVTYWDHLGWKDTFGNSEFDRRQREYSHGLGHRNVFTPQIIVNGRVDGVGSGRNEVSTLIRRGREATQETVALELSNGKVTVTGADGSQAQVYFALYENRPPNVKIRAGENRGCNLEHRNVVKRLLVLGFWHGGSESFDVPEVNGEGLSGAVFVQAGAGGPILAAIRL